MQLRQSSRATGVINRRKALALLAVSAWQVAPSWAAGDTGNNVAGLLRAGGCVVLLRHAATVPVWATRPNSNWMTAARSAT